MEIIVSVTIGAIVLVLCGIILAEAWVIYGLLNRILVQAKVAPLEMPKLSEERETPKEAERRRLFSVDIPS